MQSKIVYEEGHIYETKVLDYSEADLISMMSGALANIAAISIAASYPTMPMIPYSIARAFKNMASICFAT